jgi:hypothetical protein
MPGELKNKWVACSLDDQFLMHHLGPESDQLEKHGEQLNLKGFLFKAGKKLDSPLVAEVIRFMALYSSRD